MNFTRELGQTSAKRSHRVELEIRGVEIMDEVDGWKVYNEQ